MLSILAATLLQSSAPCAEAPYNQFDFWVGTWDVTTPQGTLAGRNVITKEEHGCLVLERWTSVAGKTGQSYNYYDPYKDHWRQVWISEAFLIDYVGNLDSDGAMALEGSITYRASPDATFPFRGKWTPHEDGTVTQAFHQFNADTDEWIPWFTGVYTKPTDAN